MPTLSEIVAFCDTRTRQAEVKDFPGAHNGLQIENNGKVTKIGAAVDAGQIPFEQALATGVDFLICHHGLYWTAPIPLTGSRYKKVKTALDGNLAVYGAHLPLDCHPEIGNNALLADALGLEQNRRLARNLRGHRRRHHRRWPRWRTRTNWPASSQALFPDTYQAIEYGSEAAADASPS